MEQGTGFARNPDACGRGRVGGGQPPFREVQEGRALLTAGVQRARRRALWQGKSKVVPESEPGRGGAPSIESQTLNYDLS